MNNPDKYPNKILLSIVGSSPAIVTETLYALTQTTTPAFIPTEIHIITTSEGNKRIAETLLGEEGKVAQLCNDYDIPRPIFYESSIHQITDKNGNILSDITNEADNEATANFIIDKLREFTENEDTSLHVSIAGGRKTMTFYMGYAMSVFGRIQDSMSHVLIDDSLTSSEFYYPTPQSTQLETRNGEKFDARDVDVKLGNLPYIRLRDGLTKDLLEDKNKSYSELIEIAQRQLAPLRVEMIDNKIHCGGFPVELSVATLSFYIWILLHHKNKHGAIELNSTEQKQRYTQQFMEIYKRLDGKSGHYDSLEEKVSKGTLIDNDYIRPHISNIKKALEKALGKPAATPYLIKSSGSRGSMSYALSNDLQPQHIHIHDFFHITPG